jgi:hypothetical protein
MMLPRLSGQPASPLHNIPSPRPVAMTLQRGERRDPVRRAAILQRIAAEFRDMPGLILSVPQASRLLGLDAAACQRILGELEKDGFLRRRRGGAYGRP